MLKIAFSGAGGTGKGTLGPLLSQTVENRLGIKSFFIPSSVQYVGNNLFPEAKNYKDFSTKERLSYQYAILGGQIALEGHLNFRYDISIYERSIFDYLAYADELPKEYRKSAMSAYVSDPYDIILFFPYDDFTPQDIKKSSWKERDQESRKKTDAFLRRFLFEDSAAIYSVVKEIRGTVEERCKIAADIICGEVG